MNATLQRWRQHLYRIIFHTDTPAGKAFDVVLLILILLGVLIVMLESVEDIYARYHDWLLTADWIVTVLFTLEYGLRLWVSERPRRYARSFLGVVDLLSFLPFYLGFFVPGMQYTRVVRMLRLLRVFRILKLARFMGEARVLQRALRASQYKIIVFLTVLISIVVIAGALMYIIEGPENGFTSIPRGVYWAVVTLTTVGYGDITPHTILGQALATVIIIMGYGIIAVPTGIVSSEIQAANKNASDVPEHCQRCQPRDHAPDAQFCKFCGIRLVMPAHVAGPDRPGGYPQPEAPVAQTKSDAAG